MFICSESSADGDTYFLVDDERTFNAMKMLLTLQCWSGAEYVEHWGGWTFDAGCLQGLPVGISKDDIIANMLASGVKIATMAKVKAMMMAELEGNTGFVYDDYMTETLIE